MKGCGVSVTGRERGGTGVIRLSLAAARINAGFTQQGLAAELGVHRETVRRWEKGRTSPTCEQLRAFSKLTNTPMDYIFLPDTLLKVEKEAGMRM